MFGVRRSTANEPAEAALKATSEVINARFVGRKLVRGNLNDIGLSLVVTDLRQAEAKARAKVKDGGDPKQLFHSQRCSLELSDKMLHVTYIKRDEGFFESSDGESTKSSSTEEVNNRSRNVEEKVIKDHVFNHNSGSDSETSNGYSSAKSASPTADIQSYKFDHKESFSLGDVIICHADREFSNFVVWVVRIRGTDSDLEALVFECFGDEDVKRVCRKYLELSKRSKLERHRRRKSDGGGIVAKSVEALFHSNNNNTKKEQQRLQKASFDGAAKNWNLVQHTDRNGVTHIEVESEKKPEVKEESKPHQPQLPIKGVKVRPSTAQTPAKSKFALELETILSKELESRKDSKNELKPNPNMGEPLSLRQRAPAMLLRKLDEFEERAARVWSKPNSTPEAPIGIHPVVDEENRKVWGRNTKYPSKMASRTPPMSHRRNHLRKQLYQSTGKMRAPSPPPDVNGHAHNGAEKKAEVLMVPTKTGREPQKKLYPKDNAPQPHPPQPQQPHPPPHLVAVPLQFAASAQPHSLPLFPVQMGSAPIAWARYPDIDLFHHQQQQQHQWMAAARVNAAMIQQQQQQQQQQQPQQQNHRGRSRDRADGNRRRAQSKSPARAKLQMQQQATSLTSSEAALEAKDTSTGISKRFRELMLFKSNKKQHQVPNVVVSSDPATSNGVLKSNLKKQTSNGNNEDVDEVDGSRKVHFNKFATVQMME